MEIIKEPIQPESDISIDRFYEEFNMALKKIRLGQATEFYAQYCVSLCRVAVAGFAWNSDFVSIRKVIDYFNCYCDIIIEAGKFESTQEFNILVYTSSKDAGELEKEKTMLKKEFMSQLYSQFAPSEIHTCKYQKAALFQGLKDIKTFYHQRYGR